jgi:hypothetical protein
LIGSTAPLEPQAGGLLTGNKNEETAVKPNAASDSEPHQQAVRFNSVTEQISPDSKFDQTSSVSSIPAGEEQGWNPKAQEEIRQFSSNVHQSTPLQQRRMSHFAFEPVSLPVSRVSSPSSDIYTSCDFYIGRAVTSRT